ncbi:ObirCsp14 [Ooceraea biroi]|uniref:ObirCsp14 n=1 Tax=Ooceraea biroi TaxID=2015173 RepID=A0A026WB73_OOCBI|nr:ejaculatory bulb-specific protein 3 [Ooceraea biroi]EZA53188.1 hypothetical protein X777_06267 [Ooceraea biroi]RLU22752.1 ObirCsp14 [Ooceraea biroi]
MARLSIIIAIISVALTYTYAAEELYAATFDDFDIIDVLNDAKKEEEFFNCFIDAGPCMTDRQNFFKGIFFEALQNNCKKCTEKQKQLMNLMKEWYTQHNPDHWEVLLVKSKA